MEFFIFLVVLIVILVIHYFIASEFTLIASEKGYDDSKYFWYTFLFGIIGALMVVALPDRGINYNEIYKNVYKMNYHDNNILNKTSSDVYNSKKEPEEKVIEKDVDAKNDKETPVKAILQNGQKICPVCGKVQNSDRNRCWECGQIFGE